MTEVIYETEDSSGDEEILFEGNDESEEISLALVVKNADGHFECNECNKSFIRYKRFLTHLKQNHSLLVEDYSSIEKNRIRNEKNAEYEEIHTDGTVAFRCKVCNSEFDTRKSVLLHLSIHQNVRDLEEANSSIQTESINCQLCNKTFLSKLDYDLHGSAHTENKSSSSSKKVLPKKSENKGKGLHCCQYCGKEFKRPHEKVKHERIHSGEKPYSCEICGKQFRVTYCLTLHKRNVHSTERPYVCTFQGCNKSFKAQSVYNHHINTHSNERKFQCPFCTKSFKTSVQLAGHKNTHTKPFSCQICKRTFSSLYAVKNHMKSHDSDDSNLKLTCKICGAQYARTFALKDHMFNAHPETEMEIEEYIIESELDDNPDSEVYSVVLSNENMTE